MAARTLALLALCTLLAPAAVNAHARWTCPKPRSPDTGIKIGPCGTQSGDFTGPFLELRPGPLTVVFEESIAHKGSPFRIALSEEGADNYESCVLLDHVPHNDANAPIYGVESTYTKMYVTINIPDVQCERCSLQLMNPMTDKLAGAGMQNCTYDSTCTNCPDKPGTCFSVYHSCANVRITGRTPRAEFTCPSLPTDWPYGSLPTGIYFIGEVGKFSADGQWLADVPSNYTTPVGPCVA